MSKISEKSKNKIDHKAEVIIMRWIFGIPLVAWPLFSYGAIFLFDAPIESNKDELERMLMVYSVWFYPLFYLAGWIGSTILAKRKVKRVFVSLSSALPAIPILCLFILIDVRS
jgi:hypothetical protein